VAILEALVGLVFVVCVLGIVYAALTLVPRQLRKWKYKRSIEGRIEQKEQELREQDSYLQEISLEIGSRQTSESRRRMLSAYRELATLRRNQLALELDALRAERDTREFEKRMERRAD
jgi:biopolymer transport protein ExbB/TolQ